MKRKQRETTAGNIAANLRRAAALLPKGDPRRLKLEADAKALDELHNALNLEVKP